MKKLLLLLLILPLFTACSSDDDKDGFSQRQVTQAELESGTATYRNTRGSKTYYLVFKQGTLRSIEYSDGKFLGNTYFDKYEIIGDSIHLTKKPILSGVLGEEAQTYTMYIQMIHWGYDKKTETSVGGDQLLFRSDENIPSKFQTGYYDKSLLSLK